MSCRGRKDPLPAARLDRWLGRQVGRPWLNVQADLHVRAGTGEHRRRLLEKLEYAVETDVLEIRDDGFVIGLGGYTTGAPFHVDGHGILRCTKRQRWGHRWENDPAQRPAAPKVEIVRIGLLEEYRKVGGVWLRLKLEPIWDAQADMEADVVTRSVDPREAVHPNRYRAAARAQVGRREIRRRILPVQRRRRRDPLPDIVR